jgi:hypothetical protein
MYNENFTACETPLVLSCANPDPSTVSAENKLRIYRGKGTTIDASEVPLEYTAFYGYFSCNIVSVTIADEYSDPNTGFGATIAYPDSDPTGYLGITPLTQEGAPSIPSGAEIATIEFEDGETGCQIVSQSPDETLKSRILSGDSEGSTEISTSPVIVHSTNGTVTEVWRCSQYGAR